MRRFTLIKIALIAVFVVATTAAADETDAEQRRQAWLQGPHSFLLSEAERSQIEAMGSDSEFDRFERLFWARRDPDPGTVASEAEADFKARVEAADSEFGEVKTRGAMSPRGQALILFGMPSRHQMLPIANYLAEVYQIPPPEERSSNPEAVVTMSGVTFNLAQGRAHVWAYNRDQIPTGIKIDADEAILAFFDPDGTGEFRLQRGIRRSQAGVVALEAAPVALLLHPDLETVPAPALWPGAVIATPDQVAALDSSSLPWPDEAVSMATRGVRGPGDIPAWILLLVPTDLASADTAAGRLRAADGAVLGTFQTPVEARPSMLGTAYELNLPGTESGVTLEVVLFDGSEVVIGRTMTIDAKEPDQAGVFVSQVFAGAEITADKTAEAGTPFVFGGYHLTPRPEGRYRSTEELCLFFFVVSPGEVPPEAKLRMRWVVDGKRTPSSPAQPVKLGMVADGVWVWGTQLPLGSLSPTSEYVLRLTVDVGQGGNKRITEVPLLIGGGDEN